MQNGISDLAHKCFVSLIFKFLLKNSEIIFFAVLKLKEELPITTKKICEFEKIYLKKYILCFVTFVFCPISNQTRLF